MKILQFAFDAGPADPYLPHNHLKNMVVYTGTHDNDTTKGWYACHIGCRALRDAMCYLGTSGDDCVGDLIRAALMSVADTAIIPFQDILKLGNEARMNLPGTAFRQLGVALFLGHAAARSGRFGAESAGTLRQDPAGRKNTCRHEDSILEDNPHWYRDAIIYQVHIKAFADSNADGIGDFRGLIGKLDYLQQLGVTAIWLLPFYPSPQRDDGYDIADYYNVNPSYNTLREFKQLLRAAHSRGIRVITELVLNHTSDQHPWFQRARLAKPGSVHRDFYVWSDTPEKYREARIIFQDFETSNWTWDPLAKAYYWHRFYSHQPDLNFDNPKVQAEMLRVIDFWMRTGG